MNPLLYFQYVERLFCTRAITQLSKASWQEPYVIQVESTGWTQTFRLIPTRQQPYKFLKKKLLFEANRLAVRFIIENIPKFVFDFDQTVLFIHE